MIHGELVVENFYYELREVDLPTFEVGSGEPTGETRRFHDIVFKPNFEQPETLRIAVRMNDEAWAAFQQKVQGGGIIPVQNGNVADAVKKLLG